MGPTCSGSLSKARVLTARGIAVVWATYDRAGARLDHQPSDPLDPVFFLRRPRGRTAHMWRLFGSRADAVVHAGQALADDEDAARSEAVPATDFDDLLRRFAVSALP